MELNVVIKCSLEEEETETSLCGSDEGLGPVSPVVDRQSWARGNSDLRMRCVCVCVSVLGAVCSGRSRKRVRVRLALCYVASRQSSGVMGLVCVRWGECFLWLYLSIHPSISLP